MFKVLGLVLALAVTVYSAEIPSYGIIGKDALFNPARSDAVELHAVSNGDKPDVGHPVYKGEEIRNQGRARIEPVRPSGPVIKHDDMLADQPLSANESPVEVNRVDDLGTGNAYVPGAHDIAYPDIPYAPGYYYDAAPINYDMQGLSPYFEEPDTSAFGLLWSQVPYGRTLVSYIGRTIMWIFNSMFTLFLGSLLTVGICSYTNLCTIAFHGVGPIHEEMRSLITPERLEKISHAADFVKTAIDKYQKIQKVTDEVPTMKRRRAIFKQ